MRPASKIELPKNGDAGVTEFDVNQTLIIVGANGTGKTRMGSWIDLQSAQKSIVHRISAQKSLSMPKSSSTVSMEAAESDLQFGSSDAYSARNPLAYKGGHRWQSNPNTHLLQDYDKLMVLLFTDEAAKSIAYRQQALSNPGSQSIPETKLDIVKRIWELVLPHRQLVITAGRVQAKLKGEQYASYDGSEMSDGERVIFYLIGQSLAAPPDGILVIDEPELHLHKSLQTKLWLEIQKERYDCIFVYLTHDLEFAASMVDAKKIWLKSKVIIKHLAPE